MRPGLRAPLAALLAFSLAAPAFPRAAAAEPAKPAKAVAGDDLVIKGAALFRQHRFEEARQAFAAAYQLTPKTPTLLNLALAEVQSEHFVEALVHLRAYASATDAEPAKVENVKGRLLPIAESKTAHITVTDAPPNAQLTLDGGTALPVDAGGFDVTIGHHALDLFLGAQHQAVQLDIAGGEKKAISAASLSPAPSPDTPLMPPSLEAKAEPPPPAAPHSHGVPAHDWVALGLGVVSLASFTAAGAFYLQGRSADDHANSLRQTTAAAPSYCSNAQTPTQRTTCADLASSAADATGDKNRAAVFAVAGGVLALGAVGTWLLWPDSQADIAESAALGGALPLRVRVVPEVGLSNAGLRVFGSF